MKYLYYLGLLLTCFGCKKEEPVIEIYLLNKVAESVNQPSKYNISGGQEFIVQKSDLIPEPFINDDQIIGLDIEKNNLILDSIAAKRIVNLKKDVVNGVQFAITVDNEIVFQGYFWSNLSSLCCPFIGVFPPMGSEELDEYVWTNNETFEILSLNKNQKDIYTQELIEAFRDSNRLIEDKKY